MRPLPDRPAQLAPLLAQLREIRLPMLATRAERSEALAEGVELRKLQGLAEHEPALAVDILQQVNARRDSSDDLRGLQQGVHLLGSGGVQRLLRQHGAVEFDSDQPGHRLCLQAMATSRLAWLYLAHWLRAALASDEDSRLSVLTLLGVARWKLPLANPALCAHIEQRVDAGERRLRVEREVLGADLDTINIWHLQDLGFKGIEEASQQLRPSGRLIAEAARCAWTREFAPELPGSLKNALRERLLGCGFAYSLALETQVDWYGPRARSLLRAASTWLARPLEETLRGVYRQALFASGETVLTHGLRAPAVGLLWPPRAARSLRRRDADPTADRRSVGSDSAPTTVALHAGALAGGKRSRAGGRGLSAALRKRRPFRPPRPAQRQRALVQGPGRAPLRAVPATGRQRAPRLLLLPWFRARPGRPFPVGGRGPDEPRRTAVGAARSGFPHFRGPSSGPWPQAPA
jgi:hypothetical protein